MADCYIVRRGGTGGGEKGIIDLTDKDCLLNMLETWFFAEGTGAGQAGHLRAESADTEEATTNTQQPRKNKKKKRR